MVDDLSGYEELHANARALAEAIVHDRDRAEVEEEEKEFDDPFASGSDDIGSVSASPTKKVSVDDCTRRTDGFCVLCVRLSIRSKVPFHCLRLPPYRNSVKCYKCFESRHLCTDIAKENVPLYKMYLSLLAEGRPAVGSIRTM